MIPTRPFHKLLSTPPHRVPPKVWKKIRTALQLRQARRQDTLEATYCLTGAAPSSLVDNYRPTMPADLLGVHAPVIHALAGRHVEHCFDLLGSGWLRVEHGMECPGLACWRYDSGPAVTADAEGTWLIGRINDSNLAEACRLWQRVDAGYQPIDWHLDFKSGHRWNEKTWYRDVAYGHTPGADVKVPWELARMQHAPTLALAYAAGELQAVGAGLPYAREFRNQVLDFCATNPPRYGVNWSCTMDVAIRLANWLIAYDLFRAHGAVFDQDFEAVFARAVYEHGLHIAANLEWNEEMVGNHYLADLAGLLIAAAHLPASSVTDCWLAFACQQLCRETAAQFHAEGSNFEASTCYHRFSAEMVIYATAVLLGLPPERWAGLRDVGVHDWPHRPALQPVAELLDTVNPGADSPLPDWFRERLERMALFTIHLTGPTGDTVQVGDNDSGRFVRLLPEQTRQSTEALCDNALDPRALVGAINGLFDRTDFDDYTGRKRLEKALIAGLAGQTRLVAELDATPPALVAYPEFGLYVFRRPGLFLTVRCGSIGQNGHGGHAHRDQLSFALCLDGIPLVVDPGSYLYTPWREMRHRFRATQMHSSLSLAGTQLNGQDAPEAALFTLTDPESVEVLSVSAEQFVGVRRHGMAEHRRALRLAGRCLLCTDECASSGLKVLTFPLAPGVDPRLAGPEHAVELHAFGRLAAVAHGTGTWTVRDSLYSPAYGVVQQTRALVLEFTGPTCHWSFRGGR